MGVEQYRPGDSAQRLERLSRNGDQTAHGGKDPIRTKSSALGIAAELVVGR